MTRLCLFLILVLAANDLLAQEQSAPEWVARIAEKLESKPRLSVLIEIRAPAVQPAPLSDDSASSQARTAAIAVRAKRAVSDVMPAASARIASLGIDVQHTYVYQPMLLAKFRPTLLRSWPLFPKS